MLRCRRMRRAPKSRARWGGRPLSAAGVACSVWLAACVGGCLCPRPTAYAPDLDGGADATPPDAPSSEPADDAADAEAPPDASPADASPPDAVRDGAPGDASWGANVIANPGFEAGEPPWVFYTDGVGTFAVESPGWVGNSAAEVEVTTLGTNVQLFQPDLALQPGTRYRIGFAARATAARDLDVALHQHVSPYVSYGLWWTVSVGTSWQTFSTEFTTEGFSAPVTDGRLRFWFVNHAVAGDVFWFDEVTLEPRLDR